MIEDENTLKQFYPASPYFTNPFISIAITYDFFIEARQDRAGNFIAVCPLIRRRETDARTTMSAFIPQPVRSPYDFDIKRSPHGCWIVCDRAGLTGGTFFSRKEAVRFALSEVGGDNTRVHRRQERAAKSMAPQPDKSALS